MPPDRATAAVDRWGRDASTAAVALLSPPGRGAIAVVGLTGPGACRLADRNFRPHGGVPLAGRRDAAICVGGWRSSVDVPAEEVVVVRRSADRIEIHCHGGLAAAEGVIHGLVGLGAERVAWAEWLRASGCDEVEVEAREALGAACGPRPTEILSRQASGLLSRELDRLATTLAPDRAAAAAPLLAAARIGLRLAAPWRIVLAGSVNAGKSSLLNALAGHARCLVSPEPGTTRDCVVVRLVLGGWGVDVVDTAGDRGGDEPASATERAGLVRAGLVREAADLVLRAVPADQPAASPPRAGAGELLVVTKADLAPGPAWPGAVVTSAADGRGLADLAAAIIARLVPEERECPGLLAGAVPFTPRQVALVRGLVG